MYRAGLVALIVGLAGAVVAPRLVLGIEDLIDALLCDKRGTREGDGGGGTSRCRGVSVGLRVRRSSS